MSQKYGQITHFETLEMTNFSIFLMHVVYPVANVNSGPIILSREAGDRPKGDSTAEYNTSFTSSTPSASAFGTVHSCPFTNFTLIQLHLSLAFVTSRIIAFGQPASSADDKRYQRNPGEWSTCLALKIRDNNSPIQGCD
jgi:hypothetical protein